MTGRVRKIRLRKKQVAAIEFMKKFPRGGECEVWGVDPIFRHAQPLNGFISSRVRGPAADGEAERARDAWFGRSSEIK